MVDIQGVKTQVVHIQVVEIQVVTRYGNSAFLDLDHLSLGISVVMWELV